MAVDARFWMITTDVHRLRDGHLIVHATRPEDPWREPVLVAGTFGIDPDPARDDDRACHLTYASFHAEGGIVQLRVEATTGKPLSDIRPVWRGTGLADTEAPHLYRLDGAGTWADSGPAETRAAYVTGRRIAHGVAGTARGCGRARRTGSVSLVSWMKTWWAPIRGSPPWVCVRSCCAR